MSRGLLRAVGSDEALAERVSAGDDEAFEELVRRFGPKLERYCRGILHHDEDARDATQSALLKALAALRRKPQPGLLVRPWLFRIAHNEAITVIRKRKPSDELVEEGLPTDAVLDPSAALLAREELDATLAGIRRLPVRRRRALLLRELEGLDYDEVGRQLGLTPAGARQAVCHARTQLRAERGRRSYVLGLPGLGAIWAWMAGGTGVSTVGTAAAVVVAAGVPTVALTEIDKPEGKAEVVAPKAGAAAPKPAPAAKDEPTTPKRIAVVAAPVTRKAVVAAAQQRTVARSTSTFKPQTVKAVQVSNEPLQDARPQRQVGERPAVRHREQPRPAAQQTRQQESQPRPQRRHPAAQTPPAAQQEQPAVTQQPVTTEQQPAATQQGHAAARGAGMGAGRRSGGELCPPERQAPAVEQPAAEQPPAAAAS